MNEPTTGSAMDGLVRWAAWSVVGRECVVRLDPGDSFRGTWGITPRVAEAVVGE